MTEDIGIGSALMMAAMFAMRGKKRRMENDPEYAVKEAERIAAKAEANYDADYVQAHKDNAEFEHSPRAFMRRLSKSKGDNTN